MNEEERDHTVCFTGHRPEKLRRSECEIRKELEEHILRAITEGKKTFITGMARGVDIWAAQAVLRLRDNGKSIRLVCACPYDGFEKGRKLEEREQYQAILDSADEVHYVCKGYSRICFHVRNRYMVERACTVIAVCGEEKGGTQNTLRYAEKRGLSIIRVEA